MGVSVAVDTDNETAGRSKEEGMIKRGRDAEGGNESRDPVTSSSPGPSSLPTAVAPATRRFANSSIQIETCFKHALLI